MSNAMNERTLYAKAARLAESITDKINAGLNANSNNEHILTTVHKSLDDLKTLSLENGFQLVGLDVYLEAQLENAQRNLLKSEFEKFGFKYENVGESLPKINVPTMTNWLNNTPGIEAKSSSPYTAHPEIDARGMPLQRFYLDEEELHNQAESRANNKANREENRNEYKLSLKFSPKMDGPKLKDRAVYKPGVKPPAPVPRMDIRIRPI